MNRLTLKIFHPFSMQLRQIFTTFWCKTVCFKTCVFHNGLFSKRFWVQNVLVRNVKFAKHFSFKTKPCTLQNGLLSKRDMMRNVPPQK